MFENLYTKSVEYDDHLLQAACTIMSEFDLEDLRDYAIHAHSTEFKQSLREVAKEYEVSSAALKARIREILTDDSE